MPTPTTPLADRKLELTEDEVALVQSYRVLGIGPAEALRRLSTPSPDPLLPLGQELQANMPLAPDVLTVSEDSPEPSPPSS